MLQMHKSRKESLNICIDLYNLLIEFFDMCKELQIGLDLSFLDFSLNDFGNK